MYYDAKLSMDGTTLLVSGANQVAVFNWKTGEILGSPFHPPLVDFPILSSFLPGTPWIATTCRAQGTSEYQLHLWNHQDGREILPSISLGIQQSNHLALSPNNQFLVISTLGDGFTILDLQRLRTLAMQFSALTPEERLRIAEVVSGHQFINNTPIRIASIEKWVTLWQEIRQRHPHLFPLHLPPDEMRRWQRNREATAASGNPWYRP